MVSKIISVDFQKEFTSPEGQWFNPGKSVNFIKKILVPYCREHNLKLSRIIVNQDQVMRVMDVIQALQDMIPRFRKM